MKPRPNITTPRRITPCGPKRSMIQPSAGPMMALSICWSAAAPESWVLFQARSSCSTAR
jgi:hypothetical protein